MRYLCLIKSSEKARLGEPPPKLGEAVAQLGAAASAAGVLVEIGGPGAKERGGAAWAMFDVGSMDEAVDWASRLLQVHRERWPGWQGECQIRRVSRTEDVG